MTLDYQGILKKTPSTSIHGLRTLKSLSDTISIQKKTPTGTDRLKRLDSSTSLFQRQTSFITKKVSTLATKLVNPFANLKKKLDSNPTDVSSVDLRSTMKRQCYLMEEKNQAGRTVMITSNKRTREIEEEEQPKERRKVQVLSVNNDIRRTPTGLFVYEEDEEPQRNGLRKQIH